MSAYGKLTGDAMSTQMLASLHLEAFRVALGLTAIVIALGLIFQSTRNISILIGTAYLGGAMAAEFSLGGLGVVPGIAMLALWIIQKLNWLSMKHGSRCGCGICNNCSDCKGKTCSLHGAKTCDCTDGACTH